MISNMMMQLYIAEMTTFLSLTAALIVTSACMMLILHQDYEDGLIGRMGLALTALASFAVLFNACDAILDGRHLRLSENVIAVLFCGLGFFFGRHVWRFLRRRRRAARGDGDWRPASK